MPRVSLRRVADLGTDITTLVTRPGSELLYVAERRGTVRILRHDPRLARSDTGDLVQDLVPVLDISRRVRDATGERGLLGLAFSPDGAVLIVSYTDGTDDGASVIERYDMDGERPVTGSRKEVLRLAQPFANHNGGDVTFGADSMLYIGFGDGGGQGDPNRNAQNPDVLLGKILRIDVLHPTAGRAYSIPDDNPFANGGGRGEIWMLGLRNPWRFAFDTPTGDLWVGDVGGSAWEEINHLSATDGTGAGRGANLGWSLREGAHDTDRAGRRPADLVDPVAEYSHDDGGCSVIGGTVVRDAPGLEALDGSYVFTDYCLGRIMVLPEGRGPAVGIGRVPDGQNPAAFAVDNDGTVMVLTLSGQVFRLVA